MHICFLTHEFPKEGFPHGGVGTFVKTLGIELVKSGVEVSVIGANYIDKNEWEETDGINIYRFKPGRLKGLIWLINAFKLNRKIREVNRKKTIDIIESSENGLAFLIKNPNIRYIIRLHGGHHFFADAEKRKINIWKAFLEKLSFSKADKIIGVSGYVMSHTLKYIDFNSKRGPVIYNPIDLARFYKADPAKVEKGRIFFAGTICEKKGIRQLIQALPLVRKSVPGVHLIVAGRDWKFPDGSSYTEWVKQFIEPGCESSLTFLGPVKNDEMPGLIEKAEVCVYPSHMEAMPLAWLEVLAMGKVFIGSRLGPGPEVIFDGATGLLCDPLNPADIAEKVIKVLNEPLLAKSLGDNARKDISERFSINILVKQNINFYQNILNL